MDKIFIYGVPGTGKTYLSRLLAKNLNIPVFEGDKLKKEARKNHPKKDYPFLYLGTSKAYQKFGSLNQKNAIKGLLAVRNAMRKTVSTKVKENKSLILEAAFLDPTKLKRIGKVILITIMNEDLHKKHFLKHREKLLDLAHNEFKATRIIQEYFINEAKQLKIKIIDNNSIKKLPDLT